MIDASAIVASFAKTTMASLQPIAAALESLATISKASTAAYVAQLKLQAQETESAAEVTIAATEAQSAAGRDATNLQIQQSRERIAQMRLENEESQKAPSGGAGGQGSLRVNPLGRGLISLGYAASSLGLTQIAQPALAAGATAQALGEIAVIGKQFTALAEQLKGMSGAIGQLAQLGAEASVALGASAGGLGAALGSILAVAAPVVAVVLGLVAVLGQVSANFKAATDQAQAYVDKQNQVNALVAKGATNQDVGQSVQSAQQTRDQTQDSLNQLEPFMRLIEQAGPVIGRVLQNQVAGSGLQQGSANIVAGLIPGIQELNDKISAASGGMFTTATALYDAYYKLTQQLQANSTAVDDAGAAAGNAGIQTNTLWAAYNDQGAAAIQDAQLVQQLSQMNAQQLRQRLDANQQEAASIQYNGALLTGTQLDIAVARIGQLDKEKAFIEGLLTAADAAQLADYVSKLKELNAAFKQQGDRTLQDRLTSGRNTVEDRDIQLGRAAQDNQIRQAQQYAGFAKQQQRAQQDFLTSQGKSQAQFDQQEQQAQADQQAKLLQIMVDARLKIMQDAANLDARAVYNDQIARDKQINDAKLTYTTQEAQRKQQFEQQKADQLAQFELQRQRQIEDFNETVQRQDSQRQLAAQRQEEDWERTDRRQADQYALQDERRDEDNAKQILKLEDQYAQITGIVGNGMAQVRQIFSDTMTALVASAINMRNGLNFGDDASAGNGRSGNRLTTGGGGGFPVWGNNYNISTPPSFSGSPFPSFAGGISFVPHDMIANIHQGERVLTAAQNRGGTGTHISVGNIVLGDIGDRSNAQVMAMLEEGLRQAVSRGISKLQGTYH